MAKDNRPIIILNLTGQLYPELGEYFAKKSLTVVDPLEDTDDGQEWTHVITKDVTDFTLIAETYSTASRDIKIISLSGVEDIQNFILANGKLILCEVWMKNPLGEFILDKFFQEYGGISLSENYPAFVERGSFNITNPFNTGEYLDRLVHSAFVDGISGMAVKTFFDHTVMYLTSLKKGGKIGLPIEVHYGYFNDVFGVQLHFFTQGLELEDVTFSLSNNINRRSDNYLLNVAVHSSDFFDFSLLKEVNKTVITALWTKDERVKNENRGLLLSELSASAKLTEYPAEGVTSFQSTTHELADLTDSITISGSDEQDDHKQVVKGLASEAVDSQLVKGSKEDEDDFRQIMSGYEEELDDIVNIVKGKIDQEKTVFKVGGGQEFDVDKFAFRISTGIEDKVKGDDHMKVKALEQLPGTIKSSFQEFTRQMGKTYQTLSESDLEVFKNTEVPKIFRQHFASEKKEENIKRVIRQGASLASTANKENEIILNLKISNLNTENENLKSKMKTLMTEIKILKDTKIQMAELNEKALRTAAADMATTNLSNLEFDSTIKEQCLQKLKDQQILSENEANKLATIFELENKLIAEAKVNEVNLKKAQIEATYKEICYAQELEKLQRQLKAKEMVLSKTKESLTKLVEQKDNELRATVAKLDQATNALASSPAQAQAIQIRQLQRQIVNHEKMIEIYRKNMQKPVDKSEEDNSREENKRLSILNNQIKNQLEMAKKEITKYQERANQDSSILNGLKADKVKLEQMLKKVMMEARKEEHTNHNQQFEIEIKKLGTQVEFLDNQLKESHLRTRELEAKLVESNRGQKKDVITDQESKGRTAHLENNVRKLSQDLVESRNQLAEMKKETNKLRQEKTALQNQLDKIKKENDKNKPAAPKKPGAAGKAA